MDETAATTKPDWPTKAAAAGESSEDSAKEEECDGEAWDTLSRSFRQVQTVLDENRALIQEVNRNHESKIPDNMAKNVGFIRRINGNISKVLSIYSDLSASFSNIVRQRRAAAVSGKNRDGDEDGGAEYLSDGGTEQSEIVEMMMAVGVHSYLLYPPAVRDDRVLIKHCGNCLNFFSDYANPEEPGFKWALQNTNDEANWLVDLVSTCHVEELEGGR